MKAMEMTRLYAVDQQGKRISIVYQTRADVPCRLCKKIIDAGALYSINGAGKKVCRRCRPFRITGERV